MQVVMQDSGRQDKELHQQAQHHVTAHAQNIDSTQALTSKLCADTTMGIYGMHCTLEASLGTKNLYHVHCWLRSDHHESHATYGQRHCGGCSYWH